MFTAQAIRGLTAPECEGYIAQFDAQISEIEGSKTRLSRADESAIEELREERRQVERQLRRLDMQARTSDKERSVALVGENGVRRLDGTQVPGYHSASRRDHEPADFVGGLRSVAMRQVDSAVKRGLPSEGAETIERLVSIGPEPERSWASRYVTETGSDAYKRAFGLVIQHGESGAGLRFSAEERAAFERVARLRGERAMTLTDSAGGYLVPFELDPAVNITNAGSLNPLPQVCALKTVVSDVWHGINSAGSTASWYAESEEVGDHSPTLSQPSIPNYRMSAFIPWSRDVEADGTNFVAEMSKILNDAAAQLIAQALVSGTGVGQPTGLITALVAAGSPTVVSSATTDVFVSTDVYALQDALGARWQPNAVWLAALPILNKIRQFESSNGNALFATELAAKTLLGRPVHECSQFDGVINATANNYVLAYGDPTQYVITQRLGATVEVIPNLFGDNGRPTYQRGGFMVGRYGADVINAGAWRVLNVT